jgi:hypothetical protein
MDKIKYTKISVGYLISIKTEDRLVGIGAAHWTEDGRWKAVLPSPAPNTINGFATRDDVTRLLIEIHEGKYPWIVSPDA